MKKNLTDLEENLSKTKNYYDYDDSEYRGIRNVIDLFDLSIDEDYYIPIIVKSALMVTVFSMKVRETKEKIYQ